MKTKIKKWNELTPNERKTCKSHLFELLKGHRLRIIEGVTESQKRTILNHMAYMKRKLPKDFNWNIAGPEVLDTLQATFQDDRVVYFLFKPATSWNDDLMTLMSIFTGTQPRTEDGSTTTKGTGVRSNPL